MHARLASVNVCNLNSPDSFTLSCVKAALNGASVVSPEALGAFFAEEPIRMNTRYLCLNHLGLNNSHCEAMAQELASVDDLLGPLDLTLTGNPSIGLQGYVSLLGLLNRRFGIGAVGVDDQNWNNTFKLVIFMNCTYFRGRFLENGVFPTKAMWVSFLAGLSTERYCWREEKKAQQLNAIWYTLRENPLVDLHNNSLPNTHENDALSLPAITS